LAAFLEANEADPIACNNYFDEPSKRTRGCSLRAGSSLPLFNAGEYRLGIVDVVERSSGGVQPRFLENDLLEDVALHAFANEFGDQVCTHQR